MLSIEQYFLILQFVCFSLILNNIKFWNFKREKWFNIDTAV